MRDRVDFYSQVLDRGGFGTLPNQTSAGVFKSDLLHLTLSLITSQDGSLGESRVKCCKMTETEVLSTDKVGKPVNEVKLNNKSRRRRDQNDLRKKVLKDQTCKHLNFSTNPVQNERIIKNKGANKPGKPSSQTEKPLSAKENGVPDLPRLSCEEKTLRVRRKLEKIIHKKDSAEEEKAADLLSALDRMKYTPEVLNSTKICLTIEALIFTTKDENLISKAKETLRKLKSVLPQDPPPPVSYSQWRDERERFKKRELEEKEKKEKEEKERKKRANEKKKKEEYIKRQEEKKKIEERKENESSNKEETEIKKDETNDKEKTKSEEEPAATAEDGASSFPSMRLGYWMDKLLSGVDQLSLLDKKVGQMEENVKKIESVDSKKCDKVTGKSVKPSRTQVVEKNVFDSDLLMITKTIQKFEIKDKSDPTKIAVVKPKPIPPTLSEIQLVLDSHEEHDVNVVIKNLKTLSSMNIVLHELTSTRLGLTVNKLRRSTQNTEISDLCRNLIKTWRKLINEPSSKANVAEEKKTEGEKKKSKEIHETKDVTDEIREYYKNKIVSALKSNNSLSDSCKLTMNTLATEIEEAIFKLYKETNSKYRIQVNWYLTEFSILLSYQFTRFLFSLFSNRCLEIK